MKTGLGLRRKYRLLITYINLFRFTIRKNLIGFDVANQFLQRTDKYSLLLILKKFGATIGKNCDIETSLTFHNCDNYSNLFIGNNCHIGKNCFFDLQDRVIIGNNVVISMQCTFITHIDMKKSALSKEFPAIHDQILINDDCYLGAGSIILKGVTLGQKSMVAAKSLVNKNVLPHTLVGGVPAKEIKKIGS